MQICSQCKLILAADATNCPEDGANAETSKEIPVGARFDKYRLSKTLGQGGMGAVFEAFHEVLNRRTAIKFLHPEFASNKVVVTRFLQEAKSVNLINHENIINVYDYGVAPSGAVYFVMEYLEGITLGDLMRQVGPMPLNILIPVFMPIIKALSAAHEKEIIHRDLKPANVFLAKREENPYFVKLLDFGVAKLRGDGAVEGLTRAGAMIGTPQYMSPEQMSGQAIDVRSDIFSLGVLLYRGVGGRAPFDGDGLAALAQQILFEDPPPLKSLAPEENIPDALDALIRKTLEKDPKDRYDSLDELIKDFDKIREDAGIEENAIPAVDGTAVQDDYDPDLPESAPSLPAFQGVNENDSEQETQDPSQTAKRSMAPMLMAGGALLVALLGGFVFLFPRLSKPQENTAAKTTQTQDKKTIEAVVLANEMGAAREMAKGLLEEGFRQGDAKLQSDIVDATSASGSFRAAPFLYKALSGHPMVRLKAAKALVELKLPEAAPKIRDVMTRSGGRLKVDLAACLAILGDKEGNVILTEALSDPGTRLLAARALVQAGEESLARPVLEEIFQSTPQGRVQWQEAAEALLWLQDEKAKIALLEELAQKDATRAVKAAEALAKTEVDDAVSFLERVVEDPSYEKRAETAIALAKQKNPSALAFVSEGLKSPEAKERQAAISVSAHLAKAGGSQYSKQIAALATNDPDRLTRYTAAAAFLALE